MCGLKAAKNICGRSDFFAAFKAALFFLISLFPIESVPIFWHTDSVCTMGLISIWYFDNKHILNAQSEAEDI